MIWQPPACRASTGCLPPDGKATARQTFPRFRSCPPEKRWLFFNQFQLSFFTFPKCCIFFNIFYIQFVEGVCKMKHTHPHTHTHTATHPPTHTHTHTHTPTWSRHILVSMLKISPVPNRLCWCTESATLSRYHWKLWQPSLLRRRRLGKKVGQKKTKKKMAAKFARRRMSLQKRWDVATRFGIKKVAGCN